MNGLSSRHPGRRPRYTYGLRNTQGSPPPGRSPAARVGRASLPRGRRSAAVGRPRTGRSGGAWAAAVGCPGCRAGRTPRHRAQSLRRLIDTQQAHGGPVSLMTLTTSEARGFGRVQRGADGRVKDVIEEAVATPGQLALAECNARLYCFDAAWLWEHLPRLRPSPSGELYLTDLVGMAAAEPGGVATTAADDPEGVIGINTREHLAQAERALRRRGNRDWMLAGGTLADPETTYIEPSVRLAPEVEILANTHLRGANAVGRGTRPGPNPIGAGPVIGGGGAAGAAA